MCVEASGQSDSLDKMTKFSRSAFPSLPRRGGCGIHQKSRSHRRAADGVVAHTTRFRNAFRNNACERPPRPRLFRNGSVLLMARPPLLCKEGNAPAPESMAKIM